MSLLRGWLGVIHARYKSPVAILCILQVATSQVLLERMIGPPKPVARVTSSMQLTGMDVTNGALLLHNGQQAEVHKINEADNTTSLLARFEGSDVPALGGGAAGGPPAGLPAVRISSAAISCSAMALHRDSVYRVAERRVEVCNLSGGAACHSHATTNVTGFGVGSAQL